MDMTTTCELCSAQTRMLSTRRCDRCWELERRIELDPELARKILDRITTPKPPECVDQRAEESMSELVEKLRDTGERILASDGPGFAVYGGRAVAFGALLINAAKEIERAIRELQFETSTQKGAECGAIEPARQALRDIVALCRSSGVLDKKQIEGLALAVLEPRPALSAKRGGHA